MATASHGAKPSPERIFATLTAFQQTEALKAAIQLDIFTKIGEGANDAGSLAKAIGASERGVRILDAGCGTGFRRVPLNDMRKIPVRNPRRCLSVTIFVLLTAHLFSGHAFARKRLWPVWVP